MDPPEQSGTAPNDGKDQPYSVVPGPPGKLHITRTAAPAPSPPAAAPAGEAFFNKAMNVIAVSVACAAAAALLVLLVLQLILWRRRLAARRRREATAGAWTPQLKERTDSCVVKFTAGVLVQHPDKQLCCGFQTPVPSPGSAGPSLGSPPPWPTVAGKDQQGLGQLVSPAGSSLAGAELAEGTKEQQPEQSGSQQPGRVPHSSLVRQLLSPQATCNEAAPQDSSPV